MNILGIESSCDETAAAVVRDGRVVLSNIINSQIALHEKYGGVVPEIASRRHLENIDLVVSEALSEAGLALGELDAVAVTHGPGLVGALLTGLSFAKGLAFSANKPLVGVNHIEGHICANYLESDFSPPFVALIVSGGHSHLVAVRDYGAYEVLGRTMDDAAGECYDKVARALGLGYPGGVRIDQAAKAGDPTAVSFPRVMLADSSLDFSFSGLKSAVLNYLNKTRMAGGAWDVRDVAASFQSAVVEVLVRKAMLAASVTGIKKIALAGGVASNSSLRAEIAKEAANAGLELHIPAPVFCTDNAAMIASCGYFEYRSGNVSKMSLNAYPALAIKETR